MLASGLALVSARLAIGPWGALATAGFFLLIRGALTLIVGPILGQTEPHFPLYLAEAICVEAVAFGFARSGRPVTVRPVSFGALAGLAIGTVGLAAEWGWSHVWAYHPWTSSMLPEAALAGLVMAVAAGTVGGFAGRSLTLHGPRRAAGPYWALPVATLAAIGVILWAVPISSGDGSTSASLELTDVRPPPAREVSATVTLDPANAADGARWFNVTSWQGGEPSIVADLEEQSPGVYRTTEPVPVNGSWKSILRLHRDDEVLGLPIFMPEDTAIPAPEIPARPSFTRDFVLDKKNLLREQKEGVSSVLTTASYMAVLVVTLVLLAVIFWGLRRLRLALGTDAGPPPGSPGVAVPPPPGPAAPSTAT
jgi:hypothetical protein